MIMKIGFDAKRAFNNHTGLGNYSRFVIAGMANQFPQHQFYLFTPKIKVEFIDAFASFKNITIVQPKGVAGKMAHSFWRSFLIPSILNKLGIDVYHGLSNELPANIKQFKGKKVVTIHDLIFLRYPQYYKAIDRKIYNVKFKQACVNADLVVAASKQTATDIIKYYHTSPQHVLVGYQNCHPQFSTSITQTKLDEVMLKYELPQQFVLCVGTIEERKNQLLVLKAFKAAGIDAHLIFVGKQTAYANQLHNYISASGLQNVKFIEGASFEDFPAFYKMAKLFVYASEFEGFGIPVLEALKCGTTAVVSNTSSLVEVGGGAVYYFDVNHTEDLTTAIKKAYVTPISPIKLFEQADKFNTPDLMEQLMMFYKQLAV